MISENGSPGSTVFISSLGPARHRLQHLSMLLLGTALSLVPGVVSAQTATTAPPESSPTAPAAAPSGQLEEIIVTATRHAESINKVPESISAFNAEKMEVLGVKSFADLAKFTPGVDFDPDSNAVSIRGIKSDAGSATTGIYIDDTPIQLRALGLNANTALPAVFDLDRVEVLRGPQGTLFGAGSEGGTVRYITPQPSLTDYTGFVHTELAGTEGGGLSYEGGAAVGGPIIDDVLGFRLAGWARRDGGWIDKIDPYTGATTDTDANRTDTYTVHAALAYKPIDNLLITPSYNFEQRTQNNYNQFWVGLSDNTAGRFYDGTPEHMMDPDRFDLGSLNIQYDLGNVRIISNTSYFSRNEYLNGYSGTLYNLSYFQQLTSQGIDPQGNPLPQGFPIHNPLLLTNGINLPGFGPYVSQNFITNTQHNLTQEIRAQSTDADSWITWTAGVFYSAESQRSTEVINDPQLPALTEYLWGENMLTAWGENLLPNGNDYVNDTVGNDMQIATFLESTVKVTDQVKATLGLRYAYTHFDFHNLNDGAQDLLDDGGVPAQESGGKDERPFTPKFSVSYNFTPDDMIYGTAAEGYRIGGASPPLPIVACGGVFPTQYNSDKTWSYELGTKDKMLDNHLQVSASAYYIDWYNIQQAVYVPQCGIQYTTNVGNAISEGFDLQTEWKATDNLTLESSIGYTDGKYSINAVDPATGGLLARKGDSLDIVPWTITLGGEYDFTIQDYDAFIRGDYEFSSKRHRQTPSEDPQTEYYDQSLRPDPATNQVSIRTGMTINKFDVNLFIDNLFDSTPKLLLAHQDQYTQLFTAETLRPRTIGMSVSYRY